MLVATSALVSGWSATTAAATTTSEAAPTGAPPRQAMCARAWGVVAAQQVALNAKDAAAWNRVADALLSLSDESFDGSLSNALGSVSTAAADVATGLQPGAPNAASTTAFTQALGALGTVCADLQVTKHRKVVAGFQRFDYETGTLTGLDPDAGARANAAITAVTSRSTAAARRANGSSCLGGQKRCGYYVQTIRQRPCLPGTVCVLQQAGLLPVGANDSQGTVDTLALDARTGRRVPLTRILPMPARASFLADVNAAVGKRLAAGGLGDDPYWGTTLTLEDVHAWLPAPDGIHVWFDKYAVAPGSFGIVHVVVPLPAAS